MNQKCKVCGEPAAGFHFGAFTCEGCKSFFGRSYNNTNSMNDCKNNYKCVINKKNRTACKACRLRKCLLVGMSKQGSRYGRRSNWFKIHCLLQEQQQKHIQEVTKDDTPPTEMTQSQVRPTLQSLGMRVIGAAPRFPPLFPRTREELMLLTLDDSFIHKNSSSVSPPDSHKSDSSGEANEARRIPIIPGLLPPTYMPHSSLIFPPGYYYPRLLQPAGHLINNNNQNLVPNNNLVDKREILDAVLKRQRALTPEEIVTPMPVPTQQQEHPIDLSMKAASDRGSSPAVSDKSGSVNTEKGHISEGDESDCDADRNLEEVGLLRPSAMNVTTRLW